MRSSTPRTFIDWSRNLSERDIEITVDDYAAQFPLLPNHFNPDASLSLDGHEGCLFETYGPELEFVRQQVDRSVWTLVDAEGALLLVSGFRTVDRVGYVVSTVLLPEGVSAQVRMS